MGTENQRAYLTDTRQGWWDLVAIQFSGWIGIPTLASSLLILQKNSFIGSVLTILVGNAIMWFIRLGIISMSYKDRQSTLDLSRHFMGNIGGYVVSALLLISAFIWYSAQTTIGSSNLTQLISVSENPQINQFAQASILIGVISACLCMEGMPALRRLSLISFPILAVTFFIILFTVPNRGAQVSTGEISLAGLSLFLATNLGVSSDLPTFFRHGQTWNESLKALTIIQVVSIAFGILSLYFGALIINETEFNKNLVLSTGNPWLYYSLIAFIFLSVICSNVANVYSASVGWEIIAPTSLVGRKEYLILGLSLTILFILISGLFSTDFLINVTDAAAVNLCIIFILGYIISRRMKAAPNRFLQNAYFSAWVLASAINTIQYFYDGSFSPLGVSFALIIVVISLSILGLKFIRN